MLGWDVHLHSVCCGISQRTMSRESHIHLGLIGKIIQIYFISFTFMFFKLVVSHEISKNYIDSNPTTGSFVDIEDVESRVSRLERRLRAMEQPGR